MNAIRNDFYCHIINQIGCLYFVCFYHFFINGIGMCDRWEDVTTFELFPQFDCSCQFRRNAPSYNIL